MNISPLLSEVRIKIRILIVADGGIHFGEMTNGFTLKELITNALRGGTNPWSELEIITARRIDDEDKCATHSEFRFDGDVFKSGKFDEVWLFGSLEEDDPSLEDSEIEALIQFMDKGGGVFATGDHESLGAAMCGKLPRVGSMRKWYYHNAPSLQLKAPGQNTTTRLDTLREGFDLGFHLDDQSDSAPQEIRPKFFLKSGGKASEPHPLLSDRLGFAITVLPDHMHEGECIVPDNLERIFEFGKNDYEEYRAVPKTDPPIRLSPEIVAISTSASGFMLDRAGNPIIMPVEPRSFVSIVAYDGDHVGVGRVVVDSSFHHFLDINLRGTGAFSSDRKGFFDSNGNPTKDYITFTQYFKNLVRWLCPVPVRAQMYRALLVDLRFNTSLVEELSPIPNPTLPDLLYVGGLTRKAITERFSDAEAIQCVLALLTEMSEFSGPIEKLTNPWLPSSLRKTTLEALVNPDFFLNVPLGAAMLGIINEHIDPDRSTLDSKESGTNLSALLSGIVTKSLTQVLPSLRTLLQQSQRAVLELSEAFSNPMNDVGHHELNLIDPGRSDVTQAESDEEV